MFRSKHYPTKRKVGKKWLTAPIMLAAGLFLASPKAETAPISGDPTKPAPWQSVLGATYPGTAPWKSSYKEVQVYSVKKVGPNEYEVTYRVRYWLADSVSWGLYQVFGYDPMYDAGAWSQTQSQRFTIQDGQARETPDLPPALLSLMSTSIGMLILRRRDRTKISKRS